MKKRILIMISALTVAALLTACGGSTQDATNPSTADAAAQSPEGTSGEVPQGTFEPGDFEMPLSTQLLVGTFMLEDTENAVNGEQAAELLPLWLVYRGLLDSDTVATEEIDALTDQIAETMTDAQMQAIEGMQISTQSMMELTQSLGLAEEFQRPEGTLSADGSFQPPEGGFPGGGEMPGGGAGPGGGSGIPGGGEGFGGASGMTQEQMEALQATREAGGGRGSFGGGMGMLFNTGLLDALIELLQSK